MSYTVNKANGDIATVVEDYQKEIIGGLNIIGYGYKNFGQDIARNFVNVLENFKNQASPYNPLVGQLWYDTRSDISTWPIRYPILRICTQQASSLDSQYVTTDSQGNITDGSVWDPLFAIDIANNRAGLLYDGAPSFPEVSAIPGSLVVRGTDGLIDSASLPVIGSVGHAASADHADQLTNSHVFGSRNSGLPFNGTQDVPLTTDYIAEGSDPSFGKYFTPDRVRSALGGGHYISVDPSSGVISYTGPDPTSGATGVGVSSATVNGSGHLVLSLTDGSSVDTGYVVGPAGPTGAIGPTGPTGPAGAVTDVITSSSYGNNGYVVFGNNLCMQWGQYRYVTNSVGQAYTVNYNISFTAPAYSISYFRVDVNSNWGTYNQKHVALVGPGTKSGFSWISQDDDSGNSGSYIYGFDWIALGTVYAPPAPPPGSGTSITLTTGAASGFTEYGYIQSYMGSVTSTSLLGDTLESLVYYSYSGASTVSMSFTGTLQNSGWTTLTIGSLTLNRTDATFSNASGTYWSWASPASNPFGTSVGTTVTVTIA